MSDDTLSEAVGPDMTLLEEAADLLRCVYGAIVEDSRCKGFDRLLDEMHQMWLRLEADGDAFSNLQEENQRLEAQEEMDDQLRDACMDNLIAAEAALSQSRLEVERLRDGLEDAHCALVAVVAAMKRAPSMQGREYVGLGIQVHSAINKAFVALSDKASIPDDKQGEA